MNLSSFAFVTDFNVVIDGVPGRSVAPSGGVFKLDTSDVRVFTHFDNTEFRDRLGKNGKRRLGHQVPVDGVPFHVLRGIQYRPVDDHRRDILP